MNQTPIDEPRLLNMLWYCATNGVRADAVPVASACLHISGDASDATVLAHWSAIFSQFVLLFRAANPTGMVIPVPPSASPRLHRAFLDQLRSQGDLPPGVPRPPEPMIRPEKPSHIRRYQAGLAEALKLWDEAKRQVLGIPPDPDNNLIPPPTPPTPPTPRPLPIPRPVTPRSPAPDPLRDRIPPSPPRLRLAATPPLAPPPPPRFDGPPTLPPPLRPPHVPVRPLAPPPRPVPVQKPNLPPSPPLPPPQPPSAPSPSPRRLVGGSLGEPAETDDPTVVSISESQLPTPTLAEPQPSKVPATFFPEVTVRPAKVTSQESDSSSLIDATALEAAERETAEVDTMLAAMLGADGDTIYSGKDTPSH